MINIDAINHVQGKSIYMDDREELKGTLYAVPFDFPVAHARLHEIVTDEALKSPGIVKVLTAADIPGENQIGGIIPDEPLFAEHEVHFWGQVGGLVIGTSEHACRLARKKIRANYDPLPAVTDPRVAKSKDMLISPPRTFRCGDTTQAWSSCDHIITGRADSNGQEHLYIETQGAYAWLKEDGSVYVASSTQGPTAVQKTIAKVLGLPMHKVEIDTVRLGGGFGGKEDQATPWAVMAALAAKVTGRPVKLALHRMDDMRMTGKRHPYSTDFRIGLSKDLKILAYEATFYQNAGAAADLSPAILERTLFHCTNAYYIPNVSATAWSCKTNLPPNTAFRGFGGPQGKFAIECAIATAARVIGVKPHEIQSANLVKDGDTFPYGQIIKNAEAKHSWETCTSGFGLDEVIHEVDAFNRSNFRFKKGYAVQPICFGISFTNTMMNHARALVHVYQDGSVVVSTAAVEMGQGVNTKLLQIASDIFGVDPSRVRIESTNTLRIANTSPTAASAGADLNGKALTLACEAITARFKDLLREELGWTDVIFRHGKATDRVSKNFIMWEELVLKAFQKRISLSEHAHYYTPEIFFDKTKEKGHPFAYHVYGTAIVEVTLDCLKGTYEFDRVRVVHDFGNSMNHDVDLGQVEGGLVQGIGWMTMEEIVYNDDGKLLSNALSTYKVPDIYSVPKVIEVKHLETSGPDLAIRKSKAVGEPPLMYGLGAYFALRHAVLAFNPGAEISFDAPYTPEKIFRDLYNKPVT